MARADMRAGLIVNADDFGASSAVNEAVIRAHTRGVLTSASLMVTGDAVAEAVDMARAHPTLAVGLHVTLVCGRPALPASAWPPGLLCRDGFDTNAARAGWRYFFRSEARAVLRREIAAQVSRFRETGLLMDHVNGHLHFHLHPVVLDLILQETDRNVPVRLTREPFWHRANIGRGRRPAQALHAAIFHVLARRAEPILFRSNRPFAPAVFGLVRTGDVDESYVLALLGNLPPGVSELYSHPSLESGRHEMEALLSPGVRAIIEERNIRLMCYRDLSVVT